MVCPINCNGEAIGSECYDANDGGSMTAISRGCSNKALNTEVNEEDDSQKEHADTMAHVSGERMMRGDITLVAEPPEFSGIKLPLGCHYIGPLIAREEFPVPTCWLANTHTRILPGTDFHRAQAVGLTNWL